MTLAIASAAPSTLAMLAPPLLNVLFCYDCKRIEIDGVSGIEEFEVGILQKTVRSTTMRRRGFRRTTSMMKAGAQGSSSRGLPCRRDHRAVYSRRARPRKFPTFPEEPSTSRSASVKYVPTPSPLCTGDSQNLPIHGCKKKVDQNPAGATFLSRRPVK